MKFQITDSGPDLPDDVYNVVLTKLVEKEIQTQDGPKDIIEWTFEIFDGDYAETEIKDSTSVATSPRSKAYAWLTALTGGRPLDIDAEVDESAIIGQMAVATIQRNDKGWPKIVTLSAVPKSSQQRAFAERMGVQTTAPARAAATAPSARSAAQRPATAATRARGASYAQSAVAVAGANVPADDLPF
jgi:hypothetical protein